MIKASFCIRENSVSFTIKGHSGFAEEGSDIVCAAVSSAAIMAANTITEIIGERCKVKEKNGFLQLEASGKAARDIIMGLKLHLEGLSAEYPDYVTVTTEV